MLFRFYIYTLTHLYLVINKRNLLCAFINIGMLCLMCIFWEREREERDRERERERRERRAVFWIADRIAHAQAVLALAVGFSFHWTAGQLYHHLVNRWKSSVRGQIHVNTKPDYSQIQNILCAVLSVPSSRPWECHLVSCLWILHFCSHGKS